MKQCISFDGREWFIEREPTCNGYPIYSGLLVCPLCHRIWGSLLFDQDPCVAEPRMASCDACQWSDHLRPVPGSILGNDNIWGTAGIDTTLLEALPAELLEREFELHLKAYSTWPVKQFQRTLSFQETGPKDLAITSEANP